MKESRSEQEEAPPPPLSERAPEKSASARSDAEPTLSLTLCLVVGVWVVLFGAVAWSLVRAYKDTATAAASRPLPDARVDAAQFSVPIPNSYYKSYCAQVAQAPPCL